jgi:hypothetical protein
MRTSAAWKNGQIGRFLLVPVLAAIAWACGSQPVTSPTSPSPTPVPAPLPVPQQYRVSGFVLDDDGAGPIANATLTLVHNQGELTTRTDGKGAYSFSFETNGPFRRPFPYRVVPPDTLGLLVTEDRASADVVTAHYTSLQLIASGDTDIVHNVRLRPARTVVAGESMELLVTPDSSLSWDEESEPWVLAPFDTLWEHFVVSVPSTGVLTVNALPRAGGIVPTLRCDYGGCSFFRGEGPVSLPVQAGWRLRFTVEIPRTRAPLRVDVQTTLR